MKKQLLIPLLFLFLLLFHGLNNYFILANSSHCLGPDETGYFKHIAAIYQSFSAGSRAMIGQNIWQAFSWEFKPPVFFITGAPFLLFGLDKIPVIMSNLVYLALLLPAVYGIGKKLYGRRTGLLAAFLVSMFPAIFASSRIIMTDFALLALSTLTFYLFVLDKFDELGFSLLTGLVAGLGGLTRQSYFIYLLPGLFYFFRQKKNFRDARIIRNFTFAALLAALIWMLYYLPFFRETITATAFFLPEPRESNIHPFYYAGRILNSQLLPVFTLLFAAGAFFSIRKKQYFLPLAALACIMIFSLASNKQPRFILPVYPYIALTIAAWITSFTSRKKTAVIGVVLFSFFQYFIINYANLLPRTDKFFHEFLSELRRERVETSGLFYIMNEGSYAQLGRETIQTIRAAVEKNALHRTVNIAVISQNWRIRTAIEYCAVVRNLPVKIEFPEDDLTLSSTRLKTDKNFDNQILQADFIVLDQARQEWPWFSTKRLTFYFQQYSDKFAPVKTLSFAQSASRAKGTEEIPGWSKVEIFKSRSLLD